ncbi:hypothetical protein HanIR_Chr10g0467481 [Helianthus annuus]|nr:hypothetical protein HanIR_Chr10g0467481 [Helianthus annuus]
MNVINSQTFSRLFRFVELDFDLIKSVKIDGESCKKPVSIGSRFTGLQKLGLESGRSDADVISITGNTEQKPSGECRSFTA